MAEREPLVDVDWVVEHGRDPGVRLVDIRWYLGAPGRGASAYASGHLPGAAFLDLDTELSNPHAKGPGRHPLPTAEAFATTLSRLGATADGVIVAYDDVGGSIAARLWWLMRHFGLKGGRVLDGGIQAWQARGLPLETSPFDALNAAHLRLSARDDVLTKTDLIGALEGGAIVLDARSRERYEGRVEPVDARPGHVPGARSAPFVDNLVAPASVFLPTASLATRYASLGVTDAAPVVAYCGSGVTACHDLLALALLGRDDAKLYAGSWSDWASDTTLPAATGPESG
jgi:thiosulfate/3-mercaptopyruvate sulfurtransferase